MGILRPFYVDSPSTWAEQDDGLDFPADPDQRHDKLPQPFRLVDKILDSVFEDAWSLITTQQSLRADQANYRKLPSVSLHSFIFEEIVTTNLPCSRIYIYMFNLPLIYCLSQFMADKINDQDTAEFSVC